MFENRTRSKLLPKPPIRSKTTRCRFQFERENRTGKCHIPIDGKLHTKPSASNDRQRHRRQNATTPAIPKSRLRAKSSRFGSQMVHPRVLLDLQSGPLILRTLSITRTRLPSQGPGAARLFIEPMHLDGHAYRSRYPETEDTAQSTSSLRKFVARSVCRRV